MYLLIAKATFLIFMCFFSSKYLYYISGLFKWPKIVLNCLILLNTNNISKEELCNA